MHVFLQYVEIDDKSYQLRPKRWQAIELQRQLDALVAGFEATAGARRKISFQHKEPYEFRFYINNMVFGCYEYAIFHMELNHPIPGWWYFLDCGPSGMRIFFCLGGSPTNEFDNGSSS